MPYPPSFRSSAASNIEPAIGASTWALGSHRCRPYRGAFTMNAISKARLDRMLAQEFFSGGWVRLSIVRCRVPICIWRYNIVTKRGRELIRV